MRAFTSLADFHAFLETLGIDPEGEAERAGILANCYLADPDIVTMPDDPFSPAYRERVLQIHSQLSGRDNYDAVTMERTPFHIEPQAHRPSPYMHDGHTLGQYLESYGHIIKTLAVKPGMSVLELGCGDAQISLHLARLGCRVTAIDIEPNYVAVVKRQAELLGTDNIRVLLGDFMDGTSLGERFDRVLFYQSFHHSLLHNELLAALPEVLTDDGFIVFGPEAIIDPAGPWRHAVPYPWGPRLDGVSLRAMKVHGWMELGFHQAYFEEALRRAGFSSTSYQSEANNLVFDVTARRLRGQNGFDQSYYLEQNPDVAASGMDPHVHYSLFGWREGRKPKAGN